MRKCKCVDKDIKNDSLVFDVDGKKVVAIVEKDNFYFSRWVGKDVVVSTVVKGGQHYLTSIHTDLEGATEGL